MPGPWTRYGASAALCLLLAVLGSCGTDRDDAFARDYAELASLLLGEFPVQGSTTEAQTTAQQIDELRARIARLRALDEADPYLADTARETASLYGDLIGFLQRPNPTASAGLAATAAVAGWAFESELLSAVGGALGADAATETVGWMRDLDTLVRRLDGLRLRMIENADRLAPTTERPVALDVTFHEVEPADVITIRNDAGRELTDVTVLVRLIARNGQTLQHVHYVPRWPPGQRRADQNERGLPDGYVRRTISNVDAVQVRLYGPRIRSGNVNVNRPAGGWPKQLP